MSNLLEMIETAPEVKTKKWAKDIRDQAKTLSNHLDNGYMELGRVLYQIWDAPPIEGDNTVGLFTQWGYKDFETYVKEELNIDRRKAERLRRIAYTLEVELSELDPIIREKLVKLGWTKMRELVTLPLTVRNAASWLSIANTMSSDNLRFFIKEHKEKRHLEIQSQITEKPTQDVDVPVSKTHLTPDEIEKRALTGVYNYYKPKSEPIKEKSLSETQDPLPEIPTEKPFWRHFMLFEDQAKIVDSAINRASQSAESKKNGHLLTLICMDYLATNDFLQGGSEQFMKLMAKYEELLGVKLIAVDAEDHEVLFGLTTLEEMSKS